jgi:hypothetical protein
MKSVPRKEVMSSIEISHRYYYSLYKTESYFVAFYDYRLLNLEVIFHD